MATLSTEKFKLDDGTTTTTYRVLFVDPTGKRQTIRLGKLPKKIAESTKLKIESLLAAKIAGHPIDAQTAGWLADIGDTVHEKLARTGLVESREVDLVIDWTLGQHVEHLFSTLRNQKPNTAKNYARARRLLEEFFGKDRKLSKINGGDAKDYKAWLLSPAKHRAAFSAATASVDLRRARQFFADAVERQRITKNPFEKIECGAQTNESRKEEVSQETIKAVIAACPDNDWRLIFAFARYAGLRMPSELEELKWSDVNWERNRFTVHAKKTEHHEGHETRIVPIFAELRPHLERAFHEAPAGSVYVVPKARGNKNLRTQAERIIKSAGVKQWERLFNNLRASRSDELERLYPSHVVDRWIGNSSKVRRDHYLMVKDSDFDRAASNPAQKTAHSGAISGYLEPSEIHESREKHGIFANDDANQYPRLGSNQ